MGGGSSTIPISESDKTLDVAKKSKYQAASAEAVAAATHQTQCEKQSKVQC